MDKNDDLRTPPLPSSDGATTQLSWGEPRLLSLLSSGDEVEAEDKRTGQLWRGIVDVIASEQGKLWMYVELGERKLFDTDAHRIRQWHCEAHERIVTERRLD